MKLATITLLALIAAFNGDALTLVMDSRTVSASAWAEYTGHNSASENSARPLAPFSAMSEVVLAEAGFDQFQMARAGASQSSMVGPDGFTAEGGASTSANSGGEELAFLSPHSTASAASVFELLFYLEAETQIDLKGTAGANLYGMARIVLGLLGQVPFVDEAGPFSFSGTLGPGTYKLTAEAFAESACWYRGEGDLGGAHYGLTAEFAVPDSGSTALLLTVALAPVAMLGWLRKFEVESERCRPRSTANPWAEVGMPDAAPAKILIVDDDQSLLRLIERALKREGFATATASSGRTAIDWLAQNTADLMLLDLKLQDIEGKELINHLASVARSVPFIIITGQGDERVAVEMMKRGALDYLVKDVQFVEFVPTVVWHALRHRWVSEEVRQAGEGRLSFHPLRLATVALASGSASTRTAGKNFPQSLQW